MQLLPARGSKAILDSLSPGELCPGLNLQRNPELNAMSGR